ncbi:MAG: hypothetical protein RIS35_2403 [Pseudomonadota bacterium]
MKPNVGNVDRLLRALTGVILIGLSATDSIGLRGWIVGLIALVTAIVRFCPACTLIGMNTCPRDSTKR